MNTRRNIKGMLVIFCALFLVLCIYLVYIIGAYGTRWFSSPYNSRLNDQKNRVIAGDILDRTGRKLATTDSDGDRVYTDDSSMRRATSHSVGDNYGQTFGAENFYSKYLLGFDQSIFERISQMVSGKPGYGSDVTLTIDAALCDTVYAAMDNYRGAVVVMNYKTGEILASVSQPTFDPKYVAEYLNGDKELDESAMVNRVTTGRLYAGLRVQNRNGACGHTLLARCDGTHIYLRRPALFRCKKRPVFAGRAYFRRRGYCVRRRK